MEKKFFCYTMEDQFQKIKVRGETRIPAGRYELKINKADTPLTLKHRKSYGDWFKYHIEITGISNFTSVYFHAGNSDDHSAGCILPNDTANNNQIGPEVMGRSLQANERFYKRIYPELESGRRVWLTIFDEDKLWT